MMDDEEQDGLLTLNIVIFMVRLRSTGNFIKGFGIFKIALSLFILVLFAVLEVSIGQRLIISIIVGFEGIIWWNFGKRIIVCPDISAALASVLIPSILIFICDLAIFFMNIYKPYLELIICPIIIVRVYKRYKEYYQLKLEVENNNQS